MFAYGADLSLVKGLSVKNYKLVWREQDSPTVRTSVVSYSLGAAQGEQARLQAQGGRVRIVEVAVGGTVPEAVLEEVRAEGAPALA
ncbi:hypothetical protein [Streptomyces sp. NPDC052811]|uniref:hypothetical protein n=1 Tax=Streptomyces sp. NPDC052811 TaxID=3155731 RepID=UPI00341A3715